MSKVQQIQDMLLTRAMKEHGVTTVEELFKKLLPQEEQSLTEKFCKPIKWEAECFSLSTKRQAVNN